ncbi:peptidase [Rhodococcoides trifolii]|uniref:Peptidase n=1 Tax=Rhodococcoides trifolii TaxID=908250 RepID=A0A917CP25_9NOCA|nr:oxygenase MpaB family protein [Rhodococcus trifolii]GGF94434.1 peptidase [Rhodococcus trifolii]
MDRYALRDKTASLDPETDYEEISRILATQEFPWDINQALSFALFRTYAVPSIGALLFATGEFTERVQKRYDDTGLILDAILEHGLTSDRGRSAVRRMNNMHGSYDIPNSDMLYVLSTFVVMPVRWIEQYGWRSLTAHEITATTNYYRKMGALMGIKDIPSTVDDFADFMDSYEAEHFAYDAGARAVADSTLALLCTFPPNDKAPKRAIEVFSRSLMDDALLDAFRYRRPNRVVRFLSRRALTLRGKVVRFMPVRATPMFARELPNFRSYPGGYEVEDLGTFPRDNARPPAFPGNGCPAKHHDSKETGTPPSAPVSARVTVT